MIILDPERSYHLADEDFSIYLAECEAERIKNHLEIKKEGNCPLLEAENMERKAKNAFIEAFEPITGISVELATHNMVNYNKLVDLTLSLSLAYCREKNIDIKEGIL